MSRRLCFAPDHDDDDTLPESLNVLDRNELSFLDVTHDTQDATPEISEGARP